MRRIVNAVSGLMMRTGVADLGSSISPPDLWRLTISFGWIINPPLATTEQARASCIAVTLISCPIGMEQIEPGCHLGSFRSMPLDSAGNPVPVFCPNPNRRTYSYNFSLPTLIPIWIAPTLLDFASTSAMESGPYAWCASWITRWNILMDPQGRMESGRRLVVSSAAASVTTLNTEPGSKGAATARFNRANRGSPGSGRVLGSNVG